MEDLNNKLAGLRDTVKKIKKEIKSFEENESKNIQRRTYTLSNKKFLPSNYLKKPLNNKNNKTLMKNYFKFSKKEQNLNKNLNKNNTNNPNITNNINKIIYKTNVTPKHLYKNIHRVHINKTTKNLKKNSYNKIINNNGNNDCDINLLKQKSFGVLNINNYNNFNYNNSCMNANLLKYISSKQKEHSRQKEEINKNNEIENIVTYSNNNNLKKNIFNNYFNKNNKNKHNKKEILYNDYDNYNNNDECNIKTMNNSTQFQVQKTSTNKTINIKDLLDLNNTERNSNNFNNSLFKFNNNQLNIKKVPKKNINKNNSINNKIEINPDFIQIYNNLKKFQKKNSKPDENFKNNYIYNSYKSNCIRGIEKYALNNNNNNLLNFQNYSNREYITTQPSYYNSNLNQEKINEMNNTINYITNNDMESDFENKNKEIFNKKNIKKILENNSIGDIYLKAKLFEKCGENNFNSFINNFCETNDLINNLKKYKKYLINIKEEENQYKKQINIYQKLCKKILDLMNPQEIKEIVNEIQDNFIENEEKDNYIIEHMKSILSY